MHRLKRDQCTDSSAGARSSINVYNGGTVLVEMDHKPLQLFNKQLRQALCKTLMLFSATVKVLVTYEWRIESLYITDILSWSYFHEAKCPVLEDEMSTSNAKTDLAISPEQYTRFKREPAKDLETTEVYSIIFKGITWLQRGHTYFRGHDSWS